MAVLTTANAVLHARLLALDTSTVQPGLTDAQYLSLLNEAYLRWFEAIEPRIKWYTPTQAGLNGIAAGTYQKTTTPVDIADILQLCLASGATAADGKALERVEPHAMLKKIAEETTQGVVARWSAVRLTTSTDADIGKWSITFHPIPAATTNLSLIVKTAPALLVSGSVNPDVSEQAAYTLARIVAARAAAALGRDGEFIQNIVQPIPDDIRQSFGFGMTTRRPIQRNDEGPA